MYLFTIKTISQSNIFMISQISHERLSVHRVSSAIFDVASVSVIWQ